MRQHRDAQMLHHAAEHAALGDRATVAVDRRRDALEWRAVLLRLDGHRVEQEAKPRFDILAVNAMVFLVSDATAIVDDAVDHQRRRAAAGLDPGRALNLLEVRWAEVEMPECVAMLRLEAHRCGWAGHPVVVVAPQPKVAV